MQEELATWAESWGVISQFINSKHMSRLDGQCLPRINLETRRIADIISSRTRRGYEVAQQKLRDTNRIPFLMDNYVSLPARDNHSGTHPEAGTQLEVLLAPSNARRTDCQVACSSKRHQVNITPYLHLGQSLPLGAGSGRRTSSSVGFKVRFDPVCEKPALCMKTSAATAA